MHIDNSARAAFAKCPRFYWESYINRLEPKSRTGDALSFGKRMHELLEEHFAGGPSRYSACVDERIELEAQATLARYRAEYPGDREAFEVVAVEQVFEVPVPGTAHFLTGKFDAIVRWRVDGRLGLVEHKTEKRGSGSNLPQNWSMRAQVALYMWAAEHIYGEPFAPTMLDVIIRQSPKGRELASFYRDRLEPSEAARQFALDDLCYFADRIEEMAPTALARIPRNTDACRKYGYPCDFLPLCEVEGGDDSQIRIAQFQPKEDYLGSKVR